MVRALAGDALALAPAPARSEEEWVDPGVLTLYLDACHEALVSSRRAAPARRYLVRERGITGELARRYGLGFGVQHTDPRLNHCYGRIVFSAHPRHLEGRMVPGVSCRRPEVRWLSAIGCRKGGGWWRTGDVDPSRTVVAVEGMADVLALDAITEGNAIATLGKANVSAYALRHLEARGVRTLLLGLDADASRHEWCAFVEAGARRGIEVRPVIGPRQGDWGDLLRLAPEDYWTAASEALVTPVIAEVAR